MIHYFCLRTKNVTFYDNGITNTSVKESTNGKYEITINLDISKYRIVDKKKVFTNEDGETIETASIMKGTIKSLPLADYISVYVKSKDGDLIYLKKHFFDDISETLTLEVKEMPTGVGIDFQGFLIDKGKEDYFLFLQ